MAGGAMRILVTGGEGFLGKYVMSRGRELGYDMRSYDTTQGYDVLDKKQLAIQSNVDAIIHLAGVLGTHELWDTPQQAIETNIMGAINAGQIATEHDLQLVCIEQPHIWYNVYEATKLAARRILTGMHYDSGLKVEFVRAHNAFGPGQHYGEGHPQKIIPTFSVKAWQGEPIPIWGDGNQYVNLVYAGDVANTLLKATNPTLNSSPLATWEAGINQLLPVKWVANYVKSYVGATGVPQAPFEYLDMRKGEQPDLDYPEPDESYPYRLDYQKLEATIDWYKQYANPR